MLIAIGFGMAFTMPAMTAAVMESAPRERAGIASAVLNASRQAGGVLGAFVGPHGVFVSGLYLAALVAGAAFLGGCALTPGLTPASVGGQPTAIPEWAGHTSQEARSSVTR